MRIHKFTLTCLLFLLSVSFFSAEKVYGLQTEKLSGRVLDETSEPIIGAVIKNLRTAQAAQTDVNGNFTIDGIIGDKLEISFVGYTKLTVEYSSAQTQYKLEPETASLEELVVVGYGTSKKVNLSGAVDYVSGKVLESRPISNISQGLQGVVPNLNISFNSGGPGEAANINIRGITSINGGEPLILIDNVPASSAELNRISPNDIESFSVIKDASAAAIYGARASFGVILITTKSGKGGLKVQYNNNFTLNRPTVIPDKVTDPYVFSRLLELSTDNTPWDVINFSEQYYQYAKQRSDDPSTPGVRIDPSNPKQWEYMGNRDWTRYFLSDWYFTHNHEMSVSGSTDKVQYYISGNYNRQNSPIQLADDYFDRKTIRFKTTYHLTDYLSIGNNTNISNTMRKSPSQYGLFDIYNLFPTSYDKNPDGTWANSEVGWAASRMTDGGRSTQNRMDLQSTFNAELKVIKNIFKINGDYTFQRNSRNYNWYTTQYQIGYGPDDVRSEGNNAAWREAQFSYYNVYNLYGTYTQEFGKHYLTGILGFNQEDYRFEGFVAEKQGLISGSFPTIQLATGTAAVQENIDTYALRGAFYRLNYTYNDRYIVELNGRYDGSSRFPKDQRFGFFPSGSVAWIVSKENFMSGIGGINLLKLRASYGELGNQAVSNYGYLPSMSTYESGYLIDNKRPQSIYSPQLVSGAYTWEKVNTLNFGMDLTSMNNRLTATFDYYTRRTLGMLTLGKQLPSVLGASEPRENAADLKTNGWELSLGWSDRATLKGKPLSFNAKFILADSYSEITRFDNPNNSILQYYKGMRLGEIWGLESDGLFTSEEEISRLDQSAIIPWDALSIVPGWPKYKDQDGNGAIEKGYTLGETKDLKIIGNSAPRFQYGLDLSADWKGFDFRAFFQGIGKRDYYPSDYLYWGFYQQPYGSTYGHLMDFYRPTADSDIDRAKHSASYLSLGLADANLNAQYPILQGWLADRNLGQRIDQAQGLAIPQTGYMLNAAYLRFKNLSVGYSLPTSVTNKLHVKNIRVYISIENFMEWSAMKKYFDPETVNQNLYTNPTSSPSRAGNGMTYPFQRSYSGGIQLTF